MGFGFSCSTQPGKPGSTTPVLRSATRESEQAFAQTLVQTGSQQPVRRTQRGQDKVSGRDSLCGPLASVASPAATRWRQVIVEALARLCRGDRCPTSTFGPPARVSQQGRPGGTGALGLVWIAASSCHRRATETGPTFRGARRPDHRQRRATVRPFGRRFQICHRATGRGRQREQAAAFFGALRISRGSAGVDAPTTPERTVASRSASAPHSRRQGKAMANQRSAAHQRAGHSQPERPG